MQPIHFSDIAKILKTVPVQQHSDPANEYLLTDSRKLLIAKQTVFFAINSQPVHARFAPIAQFCPGAQRARGVAVAVLVAFIRLIHG